MNDIRTSSLLPYLEPGENNFRLELSLISRDSSVLEKSPFPFLLIGDSTPFERLIEANIVSGVESVIQRVFLLQQSDEYRHITDEMWPITNDDINRRWKETFEWYSSQSEKGVSNPIVLAGQIGKNGELLPFQSLFYCVFKDVYFHPPCPACGSFLQLCQDSALLTASNLEPYATSLKRFLYCPDCLKSSGKTEFYVSSRQRSDPAALKDRWALVNDFGNLLIKSGNLDHFPCLKCPERTACYGTDNRVTSRLVAYSFYPFYLFVFEADTLNARDFLALMSGASYAELKAQLSGRHASGRLRCLEAFEQNRSAPSNFLFDSETEKGFLEILYLKLSFLGELFREILSGSEHAGYFDFTLSLDRVWVKLADQAGLLPQFWNFKLNTLDIWTNLMRRPHLSKFPPAYGHHFLANVWFYALLVNNRQSVEQVRAELDKYVSELSAQDQGFSEIMHAKGSSPVFLPENLFWHPQPKNISESSRLIWDKSLDLGGTLLAAGISQESRWSTHVFWQNYERLRTEIKKQLFGQAPVPAQAEYPPQDTAISDMLKRLLVKWHSEIQPPEGAPVFEETETVILSKPQPAQALSETVIVSPDTSVEKTATPLRPGEEEETLILPPKDRFSQKTPEDDTPEEEIFQETVILSPGGSRRKPESSALPASDMGKEDLPETVLISPDQRPEAHSKSVRPPPVQDKLSKDRKPAAGDRHPPERGAAKKDAPPDDDDFLAETVVLKPDKDKGKGSGNG